MKQFILLILFNIYWINIFAQNNQGILLIKSDPPGASVIIDGKETGKTAPFQALVAEGPHKVMLTLNNYFNFEKEITVKSGETNIYNFEMKSSLGSLYISSNPPGAAIFLDGYNTGILTPARLDPVSHGNHIIRVEKDNYASVEDTIFVSVGSEKNAIFNLIADFGTLGIITRPEAEIRLNDVKVGFGRYSGKLAPGKHKIGVHASNYQEEVREIMIVPGSEYPLVIDLKPKTGQLAIMTEPIEQEILINGSPAGKSPYMKDGLMVGEYIIEITTEHNRRNFIRADIIENQLTTVISTPNELHAIPELNVKQDFAGLNISLISIESNSGNWGVYLGENDSTIKLTGLHYRIPKDNNTLTLYELIPDTLYYLRSFYTIGKNTYYGKANKVQVRNDKGSLAEIEMIYVEGGSFMMGSLDGIANERPVREVKLNSFYIGKYEITQAQWSQVMGDSVNISNPTYFKGCKDCPVEMVSWNDIQDFLRKLNQQTGKRYRLPTEAEWEYAARGGSQSRGYKYSGSNTIGDVAWYNGNSGNKTQTVGTRQPNELGLYDMSGNIMEWCSDWFGNYPNTSQTSPQGPSSGSFRVLRGGSWGNIDTNCRVFNRSIGDPDSRGSDDGFRLVLSP
jgi:formylglycine-generating enzyme required for sulfatase activity